MKTEQHEVFKVLLVETNVEVMSKRFGFFFFGKLFSEIFKRTSKEELSVKNKKLCSKSVYIFLRPYLSIVLPGPLSRQYFHEHH